MKEMLKKIKEKDIDIFVFLLVTITVMAFERTLSAYDELWNFSNTYKMTIGFKIYTDLNVIITPLFFYIGYIFLKLFGANFLSYTIYNIIIELTVFMLIFKLFKLLKIKRRRCILYTICILWAFMDIIRAGANYNRLVYIPILITIMLLIKKKSNPYILGILALIIFLIKQNVGVYVGSGILVYILLVQKIDTKEKIKNIIKMGVTFILLLFMFLMGLYLDNNLYPFLDCTFLGVSEFGANNFWINWIMITYLALALFIVIVNIFAIKSSKIELDSDIKYNIKTILCIGVPLTLITFPIFNAFHMLMGLIILIIEFIYLIETTFISEIFNNRKIEKMIVSIVIILFLGHISVYAYIYTKEIQNKNYSIIVDKNSPYYGVMCEEKLKKEIETVCKFMQENNKKRVDVKVLSYKANLYMVPLNKNNNIYDLPNLGNLGKKGEDGLIEEIKQMKNTKILIQTNEEDIFWQESKKVRKYIQENYIKEGTIEDFDIYYIN